MKGEIIPARESFTRYLQSYPNGAFSLNAHYYLGLFRIRAVRILQQFAGMLQYTGFIFLFFSDEAPVSYTHLDVYKRQLP